MSDGRHDAGAGPGLADALRRPLSGRGLATAAAAATPALLTPLGPGASWSVVAGAALSVAYLALVIHLWEGRPGIPRPRRGEGPRSRASTHAMVGRAFALFVLGVFPFVAAAALGSSSDASLTSTDLLAAMLVTSLYMPAAIAAVVASGHGATAFWPFAWMRVIGSVGPAAYARLVVGFALTTALVWGGMQASARVEALAAGFGAAPDGAMAPSAVLAVYARTVVLDVLWLVQAAFVGALLRRHRSEIEAAP